VRGSPDPAQGWTAGLPGFEETFGRDAVINGTHGFVDFTNRCGPSLERGTGNSRRHTHHAERDDYIFWPDVVLARHRTVVLVHGCFWHRHAGCRFAYTPKSRVGFWRRKFRENVGRDVRTVLALEALGWRVVTVWECETHDLAVLQKRLRKALRRRGGQMSSSRSV
jgi:DNA mismatch endonuclease Vsr